MEEEMGVSQGGGDTGSALERHTPGPWEVWDSLYEGMAAAVVRAGSDPLVTVAEVRDFRDARLIASMPELLKAAQRAIKNADEQFSGSYLVPEHEFDQLVAAVTKAEGVADGSEATKNPRSSDPGMNKESVSP